MRWESNSVLLFGGFWAPREGRDRRKLRLVGTWRGGVCCPPAVQRVLGVPAMAAFQHEEGIWSGTMGRFLLSAFLPGFLFTLP